MSFTKIQKCFSITVHEEVVDLVEVVHLHGEHDEVLFFFATRSFHSAFEHFFGHNRPGIRVFESLLDSQRESALFVDPEESLFAHFLSCVSEFFERSKLVSQMEQPSVSPFHHD